MGVIKKIKQKIFNGTDWDTLHPETETAQVLLSDGRKLNTIIDKMGKAVTVDSNTDAYCIGGKIWIAYGRAVSTVANSDGGANWTYTIPTALKVVKVLTKPIPIATNDADTGITTGYVVDNTPSNINTYFKGQCYDMTTGEATRIRFMYLVESNL